MQDLEDIVVRITAWLEQTYDDPSMCRKIFVDEDGQEIEESEDDDDDHGHGGDDDDNGHGGGNVQFDDIQIGIGQVKDKHIKSSGHGGGGHGGGGHGGGGHGGGGHAHEGGHAHGEEVKDIQEQEKPKRQLVDSVVHDVNMIDNMIFYKYRRDILMIMNNRQLTHWFLIFTGIMSKVQFPSILGLIDREELLQRKV